MLNRPPPSIPSQHVQCWRQTRPSHGNLGPASPSPAGLQYRGPGPEGLPGWGGGAGGQRGGGLIIQAVTVDANCRLGDPPQKGEEAKRLHNPRCLGDPMLGEEVARRSGPPSRLSEYARWYFRVCKLQGGGGGTQGGGRTSPSKPLLSGSPFWGKRWPKGSFSPAALGGLSPWVVCTGIPVRPSTMGSASVLGG